MSGDYSAAADDEIIEIGDSMPLKKPKTDPKAEEPVEKVEAEAEAKVEAEDEAEEEEEDEVEELPEEVRNFLPKDWNDPEYKRQADLFLEQVEKSEGFYMDLDEFDYKFAPVKFEWRTCFDSEISNKDLMDLLMKTAIEDENERYGTQLELVNYVSANVTAAQGLCFYITLLAKDLSSPNPEPQLYQTFVSKFRDDIRVHDFKLKPPKQD